MMEDSEEGTYFVDDHGRYYFMPKVQAVQATETNSNNELNELACTFDRMETLTVATSEAGDTNMINQIKDSVCDFRRLDTDMVSTKEGGDTPNDIKEWVYKVDGFKSLTIPTSKDGDTNDTVSQNIQIQESAYAIEGLETITIPTSEGPRSLIIIQQPPDELTSIKNEVLLEDYIDQKNMQSDKEVLYDSKLILEESENQPVKYRIEVTFAQKKSQECPEYFCVICKYSTKKRESFRIHIKKHERNDKKVFMCQTCTLTCPTQRALRTHSKTHKINHQSDCKNCEKSFKRSSDLLRHMRYVHKQGNRLKCPHCEVTVVERSKLKRHMVRHQDILKRIADSQEFKTNFFCDHCSFKTDDKQLIRKHIQNTHQENQPLECDICEELLPTKYTYNLHKKTHKDQTKFKCHFCYYKSTKKYYLKSHLTLHKNEKVFFCDKCNTKHGYKYNCVEYAKHKIMNAYCSECGEGFTRKCVLIRHITEKHQSNKATN